MYTNNVLYEYKIFLIKKIALFCLMLYKKLKNKLFNEPLEIY
jgi:hypothetical protein